MCGIMCVDVCVHARHGISRRLRQQLLLPSSRDVDTAGGIIRRFKHIFFVTRDTVRPKYLLFTYGTTKRSRHRSNCACSKVFAVFILMFLNIPGGIVLRFT